MNNEKLKKMLHAAEKYGADAVCEMVAEHTGQNGSERIEAVSSGIGDDNASQIANLINAGTQRIIEGGEKRTPDRSLAVDLLPTYPCNHVKEQQENLYRANAPSAWNV